MMAVARRPVWQHWGLLARWGFPVVAAALVGCTSTTTTTTSSTSVPQTSVMGSTATPSLADANRRAQIRLELAANYFQAGRLDVAMEEVGQALAKMHVAGEGFEIGSVGAGTGAGGDGSAAGARLATEK